MDDKDNSLDNPQAADLIRQKLNSLFTVEPSAKEESAEVSHLGGNLSKHQAFMAELNKSGKDMPEIQAAWHEYYQSLDEEERHEVWQEFYAARSKVGKGTHHIEQPEQAVHPEATIVGHVADDIEDKPIKKKRRATPTKSVAELKQQLLGAVRTNQKLKAKQHLQSIIFGLGIGSFVMLIMLFSFFNERFIAPLITPSKQVSSTPIIIDNDSTTTSDPVAKVIIPKINVEIPVVYDESSIEEAKIQTALERGVVHYANTPNPGEQGNVVVFGHSSNNIFNKGQYKFAFVLLSRLENGDNFYLTKGGKRYTYRVYQKKIVPPTAVEVLQEADKPDTATLITCDPPGTSLNRLVIIGEQISPAPGTNGESTAKKIDSAPVIVPSNSTTLWDRLTSWL